MVYRQILILLGALAAFGPPALLHAQVVADPAAPTTPTVSDPTAPPAPTKPASSGQSPPSPFTFTAAYTADLLAELQGGRKPGGGYVDLIKASAAYDGTTAGHTGLSGLVSIEHANGSSFTGDRVGGIQAVSADEAQPAALRIYEVWLQKEFLHGQGAVKGGLIDINTTFDVQETAALFLNASHGIGPDLGDTGLNGPSDYPTTALALAGVYRPAEGWTAQMGIFDAVAGDPSHRGAIVAIDLSAREGALLIAQVEKRIGDVVRIEGGAWTYTSAFPSLDRFDAAGAPRLVHGNGGVYGLVEGRILAKPGENTGGLSGWARVGFANGEVNRAENYFGAGMVYTGLVRGRDRDAVGFAVARVGLGHGAQYVGQLAGLSIGDGETDFEATYRFAFKDWLNIQPDLQYVIHPGGDRRLGNALVLGLRLALTISK